MQRTHAGNRVVAGTRVRESGASQHFPGPPRAGTPENQPPTVPKQLAASHPAPCPCPALGFHFQFSQTKCWFGHPLPFLPFSSSPPPPPTSSSTIFHLHYRAQSFVTTALFALFYQLLIPPFLDRALTHLRRLNNRFKFAATFSHLLNPLLHT